MIGRGGPTQPRPAPTSAGWSDADLATLAELAETFVRGGAVRHSGLAAEALARAADPAQVRQLRLVLRLLQSRAVNLVLTGRPIPFRDRSPAERERVLLSWGTSRVPLRRSLSRRSGTGSIPWRSSPACSTNRSRCGAARCRRPDRWSSAGLTAIETATSSNRRPAIPA